MKLKTTYMGLELANPLVPSASPLSRDLDMAKRLEDAGAAALVMYSLFEEQINHEASAIDYYLTTHSESYAEALSYLPEPETYNNMEAEEYLEQIASLRKALRIPVIASLNGVSPGGWIKYATRMEAAGANGIELNIYYIPTDPTLSAGAVEGLYLQDLQLVKKAVHIPVSMKLSPYFSSFANMAMKLDAAGADALVLFNRFYQPDFDLELREVVPNLQLSSSYESRLPLRWISILKGNLRASLAATSGVHTAEDVLKLVMAGADVTMLASALLKQGPELLPRILHGMSDWLDENECDSIEQIKGSMSYMNVAEPAALVRANYIKTLQSF